eukprot:4950577-Pleurochrysis_carterae.AAC.1
MPSALVSLRPRVASSSEEEEDASRPRASRPPSLASLASLASLGCFPSLVSLETSDPSARSTSSACSVSSAGQRNSCIRQSTADARRSSSSCSAEQCVCANTGAWRARVEYPRYASSTLNTSTEYPRYAVCGDTARDAAALAT